MKSAGQFVTVGQQIMKRKANSAQAVQKWFHLFPEGWIVELSKEFLFVLHALTSEDDNRRFKRALPL